MKQVLLVLTILVMVTGLAAQIAVAWGDNTDGQCNTYIFGNNYGNSAVAAGAVHSIGWRFGEGLFAWGDNSVGQCDVPAGNDFRAIATKGSFNIALRWDGSLVAWGENDCGQCDVPSGNDFRYISAGVKHGLALRTDGSIVAWGAYTNGLSDVPPDTGYVMVAAGQSYSIALKADHSIVAWGLLTDELDAIPAGNNFESISAGWRHALALKSDSTVVAWGDNSSGQCDVPPGNHYTSITAGRHHSLATRNTGFLVAWGSNSDGQCDVPAGNHFYGIAAGQSHSIAMLWANEYLESFTVILTVDYQVQLNWVTEYEANMLGFNIYRSETNNLTDAVRLNGVLIAATNSEELHTYSYLDSGVENGHTYYYWLDWVYSDSGNALHGPCAVTITGQPMPPPFPDASEIEAPHPNPVRKGSNPHFRIAIKGGEKGTFSICNAKGQVLQTYHLFEGRHSITWESSGYGSGIYFYRLATPSVKIGGKLVILK